MEIDDIDMISNTTSVNKKISLDDIQKKYNEIVSSDELDIILDKGKTKSILLAQEKYELMCNKMGLIR